MKNNLLGFSFFVQGYDSLVTQINSFIDSKKNCFIITPTTEILYASYKDEHMTKVLSEADILLPDSITLVKLGQLLKRDFPSRLTGIDTIYKLGNNPDRKYKVFYLGAKQESVEKAVKMTEKKLPSFDVVGYRNGYFDAFEDNAIIEQINASGADILFVGIGFPKQESFVHQYKNQIEVPIKVTVGGSFDVIAGLLKRAPKWMQKLGLEWLFRLIQEPSRITRMSLIPIELFQLYVAEIRHER